MYKLHQLELSFIRLFKRYPSFNKFRVLPVLSGLFTSIYWIETIHENRKRNCDTRHERQICGSEVTTSVQQIPRPSSAVNLSDRNCILYNNKLRNQMYSARALIQENSASFSDSSRKLHNKKPYISNGFNLEKYKCLYVQKRYLLFKPIYFIIHQNI